MSWIIVVVILIIVGFILDREIYFYEGAHFGPRFQSWFYDRWATKYDAGKRESQLRDNEMLAAPLLEKIGDIPQPFVLDFATGTGRLSYALLNRTEFKGRIIAVDISQKMLEQAVEKITGLNTSENSARSTRPSESPQRVEFLRHLTLPLPFPDAVFDVVCCLEVLELLPDAQAALNEMSRLVRPGGVLLTSRGTEESGRKAKVKSATEMTAMLERSGFENVHIMKWWKLFDRVLADKKGTSQPVGAKSLMDVLQCSSCAQTRWVNTSGTLRCSHCGNEKPVTAQGIVLN